MLDQSVGAYSFRLRQFATTVVVAHFPCPIFRQLVGQCHLKLCKTSPGWPLLIAAALGAGNLEIALWGEGFVEFRRR